jgi:hypothetical protein
MNNLFLHLGPVKGAATLGLSCDLNAQLASGARGETFKASLGSFAVTPHTSFSE